ncbi:hypothetical protein ZWY2020_012134 [Hordeum vulgare]|nr:hypothetical protein ZWY2020_020471 [Hordeum vulgare]KAI5009997.1 hypothetical protein ZWY2020_012134 [Hordeum vulgare]
MRRTAISLVVLLFFVFAAGFLLAARGVDGARSGIVDFAGNSRWPSMGGGGGYELPRARLIPPSGPSERHNSVGPESTVPEQQQQSALQKP